MKRMKKLIAALMAVAMIASLNISAFATGNTGAFDAASVFKGGDVGTSTTTDTVVGTSGSQTSQSTLYSGATDKAYGYVTGQFSEEGKMPAGTVHIVMPVISTTASPFNMILDPNDLIGQSTTKRIEGITANTDYVYFTNYTDGAASGYTSTSDALTIYNKGTWPLSVKLSAELTKGDDAETGSLIQMVSNKTALSSVDNKDIPSMYMAVTPSTGAAAVVVDGYGKPSMAVSGTIISKAAAPTFTFAENVLSREKKVVNEALSGKSIQLSFNGSGNVTVQIGTVSGTSFTASTTGSGATLETSVDGTAAKPASGNYSIVSVAQGTAKGSMTATGGNMAADIDVKLLYNTADGSGSAKTVATIKVALDPVAMSMGDATTAETGLLKFTKSTAASSATTAALAIAARENAYEVTYKDATNGYVKQMTDAVASAANDTWPSLSFTLGAAINKTTAWDDLNDTTVPHAVAATNKAINTLKTKVIWDIANNYDADTAVNAPRVKVTQYANADKDEVRFKLSFGKGSNAAVGLVNVKIGSTTMFPSQYGLVVDAGTPANTTGIVTKLTPVSQSTQTANTSGDGTEYTFKVDTAAVTAKTGTLTYLKPDMSTGELTFTFIKSDV